MPFVAVMEWDNLCIVSSSGSSLDGNAYVENWLGLLNIEYLIQKLVYGLQISSEQCILLLMIGLLHLYLLLHHWHLKS